MEAAWSTQQALGQPRLHNKTMSHKKKKKKRLVSFNRCVPISFVTDAKHKIQILSLSINIQSFIHTNTYAIVSLSL